MVDEITPSDMEALPEVAVWNLVFLAHPREHWWDFLTPEPWRHVCAFGYANGRWIVYDAGDTRSQIMVMNSYQFDMWFDTKRERVTDIVRVRVNNDAGLTGRLGLWCVTAVKHLAGIRSSALRPRALHRDLIRSGCERVPYGHEGAKG